MRDPRSDRLYDGEIALEEIGAQTHIVVDEEHRIRTGNVRQQSVAFSIDDPNRDRKLR